MATKKKAKKKPAAKAAPKRRMPGTFVIVLAVLIAGGLAAGIAAGVMMGGDDSTSSSGVKLPSYASAPTAPKGSAKAYQFAIDYPEFLAAVPCYCGCGDLESHESNLDCFIKSRNGDAVEFDDHASY